jgi:hypothetical protein
MGNNGNPELQTELRKLLTRRSRLMMRSFNLQEWFQDGSVRSSGFAPLIYIPNNEASDMAG